MIGLLEELDIYATQLNEWFLSGVKPEINLISIKLKLISLKLNTNLKDKDLKKNMRKEKYKLNKNEILKELKKKIICECGAEISKSYKYQHIKTKKHITHIQKYQST